MMLHVGRIGPQACQQSVQGPQTSIYILVLECTEALLISLTSPMNDSQPCNTDELESTL